VLGIKPADHAKAHAQAAALRLLPDIADALAIGQPEVSAYWLDPITGALCKCRPDWVHDCGDAGVILLDVKTTADASPEGFARSCATYRYHVQAAYYSDGYQVSSGRQVLGFVFAAVEQDAPYLAAAYMLDDEALAAGRREYRRCLNLYHDCHMAGEWPGYSSAIECLTLPKWVAGALP
jgi:hypothetical protein